MAIGPLIARVRFAPLALAIAGDIGVLGIGFELGAMVLRAALALAVLLTAKGLIGPESGGCEGLLAVTAGTKRQIIFSGDCL